MFWLRRVGVVTLYGADFKFKVTKVKCVQHIVGYLHVWRRKRRKRKRKIKINRMRSNYWFGRCFEAALLLIWNPLLISPEFNYVA